MSTGWACPREVGTRSRGIRAFRWDGPQPQHQREGDSMSAHAATDQSTADKKLFWACFMSLIATAFGFAVRGQIITDLGKQFDLSATQQGEIFGAGLWPFA